MLPNRIKAVRKERGKTLEDLAELTDLSTSYLSRVENGERDVTLESLGRIAEALNVSAAELLDYSKAWQDVPIFGTVGELGIVTQKALNGIVSRVHQPVRIPAALGDVLALAVSGTALYPRYNDGDLLVCPEDIQEAEECIGRECLVQIKDGPMVIRTVYRSALANHFQLSAHNQPPVEKELASCRPIIYVGRDALAETTKARRS